MISQPSTSIGLGHAPMRIVGKYALFGLLWIWLSDWVLNRFVLGAESAFLASALKGTAYVTVTAVLLYWLVRREVATAQRTENLLRAVVEGTTDAVFVKDVDGRYLLVNDAAARFVGRSVAEVLGRNDRDLFETTDAERIIANDRATMTGGHVVTWEETITSAGATRNYHATKAPFRDAAGVVSGVIGVSRDITKRKATEDALRVSEQQYRELANAIPQIVWTADVDGKMTQINANGAEYIGGKGGHTPDWSWESTIHPDEQAEAIALWTQIVADGVPRMFEMRIRRADGQYRWHIVRQRAIRDADDRIVSWVGTNTDVDDLKQAENALRETEARLREAQRIARLGSWSWEPQTDRVSWSDAEFELFGIDREAVTPAFETFLALLHPDDRAIALARVESIRAGADEFANDLRVIRPDGTNMWIHSRARVTRDDSGALLRVEGTDQDITARRLADDALRESKERLQEAVRVAGIGVFEHDHHTETFFWSARLREIYGINPDEPIDLTQFLNMIHPDDMEAIADAVRRAHDPNGDGRFDVEHRVVRRADGRVRWITTQSQTRFAGAGQERRPVRTVGATMDVTDAREAAAALRESEERYRRLMKVLPTAVLVHDGERIRYCNPAFVRLIGACSAEEVLTRRLFDWVSEEYRQLAHERLAEMIATNDPVVGTEIRLTRIDGRTVPTHSVATPITGYGHEAFLIALSDLTAREQATQLLRSVLSSVSDSILTINERGMIDSANPAAMQQFGWSEEELIGTNVNVLMPNPHGTEHDEHLANHVSTGVMNTIGVGREVECLRRDGTRFPAELTVTEFLLDGERHFTGVLRDIAERQRLQSQFIQAQKMEAIGQLAGGVAHDFNNLLTIINGYSDLLLMSDFPAGDMRRDSIVTIRDAGERAARLTQQLLAFSRKAIIEPKLIDLNVLVSDSARLLRRLIGEDIILSVITAPNPVFVKADSGQLEQVIMNLVVNARDAMPVGGRLTIETSTVSPTESASSWFASLTVSDTGHGMSDEMKGKIFEPFFTTKGVGHGTGLGLAVVHGVISQNGGRIVIESAVGIGTTFRIQLPLVANATSGATADSLRRDVCGSETILLVEDDDAVRKITRISLQSQGYTVLEANRGTAALRIVQEYAGDIHLLLSDVVMPEMGGRQVLNAVREYRHGLPVLFMSGYTDDAILLHGVVEATDAFIQKPFTPINLARKVRELLDVPK